MIIRKTSGRMSVARMNGTETFHTAGAACPVTESLALLSQRQVGQSAKAAAIIKACQDALRTGKAAHG